MYMGECRSNLSLSLSLSFFFCLSSTSLNVISRYLNSFLYVIHGKEGRCIWGNVGEIGRRGLVHLD